jgi:uncharacterized protein (TIGR03437 family)
LFVTGSGGNTISVHAGAKQWEVLSNAPAEGLPGVSMISVRVPADAERGPAVNLQIEAAGIRSQQGTTASIR